MLAAASLDRSAKVEDGVVTNVIVGELPDHFPCGDEVQIGWSFDGEEFAPPPPVVLTPEEQAQAAAAARKAEFPNLFPDQFWFGVRAAGYEDDVRAWVASLNDPESSDYDPVVWAWASAKLEFSSFFERDHALVQAAQQAIGISETELDDLWKFAASGPEATSG